MQPSKRPPPPTRSLYRALASRQTATISDHDFRTSVYNTVVPSSTFVNVSDVPPVTFRRFTPCGRYLITLSRNSCDLIVFQLETGGLRSISNNTDASQHTDLFQSSAHPPLTSVVTTSTAATLQHSMTPPLIPPMQMFPRVFVPPSHPGILAALPIPVLPIPPIPNGQPLHHPILQPQNRQPQPPPAPSRHDPHMRHSCSFHRFFRKLYQVSIHAGDSLLVQDFCQATPSGQFIILASVRRRDPDNEQNLNNPPSSPHPPTSASHPPRLPALSSTPVFTSITLHLVAVESGQVVDRFTLYDDYVPLDNHYGVHMCGPILSVLSVRYQTIHVLRVQESTSCFTVQAVIGYNCHLDDELVIAKARHAESSWQSNRARAKKRRLVPPVLTISSSLRRQKRRLDPSSASFYSNADNSDYESYTGIPDVNGETKDKPGDGDRHDRSSADFESETGFGNGKTRNGFYTGLMQRLLAYVYRRHLKEGRQKMFYRVVGQYSLLLIHKVQLLDHDHLLIRLGSYDRGGNPADALSNTCFFLIYCISSTKILNLFDNKSLELASLFDRYRDDFVGDPMVAASFLPARAPGAAENVPGLYGNPRRERITKRMRSLLSTLPFSSQVRKPSVYLDRSLFTYNPDLLPALDGTKALSLREVRSCKFRSARTGDVRFKLAPASMILAEQDDANTQPSRTKMLFHFHPFLPLVLCMEYGLSFGTRLNLHVYGFHDRSQE